MAKNDKILFDGNTTTNLGYTQLKKAAQEVLDLTGTSFTWNQSVGQYSIITADQVNEIINAVDAAYGNMNTGCNAVNAAENESHCNHEESGNSTHCASNKSSVKGNHNSSVNPSANSSAKSGKNTGVNSSYNNCTSASP